MADIILSYTIPEGKVAEYIAYYVYRFANKETIPDPAWVNPEDGSEAPRILKYTDAQWVREHIMRTIREQIVRGRNAKYRNDMAAYNANDIE